MEDLSCLLERYKEAVSQILGERLKRIILYVLMPEGTLNRIQIWIL